MKQRPKGPHRMKPQEHVLLIEEGGPSDLVHTRGEVVVPEERHPLQERIGRRDKLTIPPGF